MGNPNPFYRFKQAWNAGFYPDNQISSDLLNEVYGIVTTQLPGWSVPGVKTINQLLNSVKSLVNTYNASPYYGGMSVSLDLVSAPPDYNYTITVKYDDLYVVDNSQAFTITGTASNPGKIIATAVLSAFSPGSYIGTFDPTFVPEEEKVKEALTIVDINGSAIFPITYSYNATTGVATSGLARAKDWQLVEGVITRLPAPTNPFQNHRTFQLPQLNGDDTFIMSVMERIIQASLADGDYITSVLATFNSFTLPDAYITQIYYPAFTTYERVQFDFIDDTRRCFSLVGRKNSTWLWQRFVTDQSTPYDFLNNYTEVTALPYEVMQAGRWVYPYDTYDIEFVDFTSSCYVSPEFYPMPAKPGDQLQFNVVNGNLEGITNVNVGLFSTEGQFIQQIGTAEKLPTPGCECVDCGFLMELNYTPEAFQTYLDGLNAILDIDPEANVFTFKYVYLIDGVEQSAPASGTSFEPGFQFTTTNIFDYLDNPVNFPLFESFKLELVNGLYRFSLAVPNAVCGSTYQFKQYFRYGVNMEYGEYSMMWDSDLYECPTPEPLYELVQHQAQVTIPSKQGCYRMGLYEIIEGTESVITCTLNFQYSIDNRFPPSGPFNTFFEETLPGIAGSANPYITFNVAGTIYTYALSGGYTPEDIIAWCNANIPGMVAVGSSDTQIIYWTVTQELSCNEEGYTFRLYQSDYGGNEIAELWTTETYFCDCVDKCQISLFDYGQVIGGVLFQAICDWPTGYLRVSLKEFGTDDIINQWIKPIAELNTNCPDPDYEAFAWVNTIPGLQLKTWLVSEFEDEYWTCSMNAIVPCNTGVDLTCEIVDINGNPLQSGSVFGAQRQSLPFDAPCDCLGLCEQTFSYTIATDGWDWLYFLQSNNVPFYSIYLQYGNLINGERYEVYNFNISDSTAPYLEQEALVYFNSVPGMVCQYDSESGSLTFNWTALVPCDTEMSMTLAGIDGYFNIDTKVFTSDIESCTCPIVPEPGQWYAGLYSLSNIINIDKADCFSTILEFWSDNNTMAEGFEYYNNWKQRVRIGLNGGGEKPIIEESLYRQSNGVHRRPQNKQDLSLDLHTDFFDLDTQLAMTDATRHPYLVWEGKPIFVKGDIEVATTQDFTTQSSFETLSQMKFQALKQGFQPRNSSCLNC